MSVPHTIAMAENGLCSICGPKIRLAYSFTGVLIGFSVLFVFGFRLHNWNAALWGLLSGIIHVIGLRNTSNDSIPYVDLSGHSGTFSKNILYVIHNTMYPRSIEMVMLQAHLCLKTLK